VPGVLLVALAPEQAGQPGATEPPAFAHREDREQALRLGAEAGGGRAAGQGDLERT